MIVNAASSGVTTRYVPSAFRKGKLTRCPSRKLSALTERLKFAAECNLGPYPSCLNGPAVSVNFAQGRNRFRGPSYFNTDLAVMKSTKIPPSGDASLGIGFQFFNLFNHPNFSLPDGNINDPTFGQILGLEQPPTGILGAGLGGDVATRMIQLKVQVTF